MTLAVDVTRHPFSFDPDAKSGVFGSWQDMLHGTPWEDNVQGHHSRLDKQGAAAGIKFQYDVAFDFHPIDSQRLVLWAARFGKQEELVEAMSANHFTRQASVNEQAALLKAVHDVGLDPAAAAEMLDSEELTEEVWVRTRGVSRPSSTVAARPLVESCGQRSYVESLIASSGCTHACNI